MTNFSVSIIDNDNERSAFSIPTNMMTSLTYDVINLAVNTLEAAIADVTLGAIGGRTLTHDSISYNPERPTAAYANRESGVVFYMASTSNPVNKVRATLPAPDLDKFPFAALGVGRVEAPFGTLHGDLSAFITALEAATRYVSADWTVIEPVEVRAMEFIGRNL